MVTEGNNFTPRNGYPRAPSVLSSRSIRSCASNFQPKPFLTDFTNGAEGTETSKSAKPRRRAKPFSCGLPSNILNIFAFSSSLLLFTSSFLRLQSDSDANLFDVTWLLPSFVCSSLFSRRLSWLPFVGFVAHVVSLRFMTRRRSLPDLVAVLIWFILSCLKLRQLTKEVVLYQLGFSAILSIVAFAVTFFPRKPLHRKKPNSVIQSAFSLASTPISQCSTATARSTPSRLFSGKRDHSPMEEDQVDSGDALWTRHRDRQASPSRELNSLFGGLSLGRLLPEPNADPLRHRGPFGSMKHPVLAPSRFGPMTECSFRPESAFSSHYAASTVPSLMTSVSQVRGTEQSFSLFNVLCVSALSVSFCLNLLMLYYILYVKCV